MQTSNVSTPINANSGTIFLAVELSRRTWLVTMHSPDRNRISRYKVTGGDHAGLLALIAQVRGRVMRALGYEPPVVSFYEAGYDGFWLHRLLTAAGLPTMCWTRPALRSSSGRDGRRPTGSMARSSSAH